MLQGFSPESQDERKACASLAALPPSPHQHPLPGTCEAWPAETGKVSLSATEVSFRSPESSPQSASVGSILLQIRSTCHRQRPPYLAQSSDLKAGCGLSSDSIRLRCFHSTKKGSQWCLYQPLLPERPPSRHAHLYPPGCSHRLRLKFTLSQEPRPPSLVRIRLHPTSHTWDSPSQYHLNSIPCHSAYPFLKHHAICLLFLFSFLLSFVRILADLRLRTLGCFVIRLT